jgi:hypothetical protein
MKVEVRHSATDTEDIVRLHDSNKQ